MAATRAVGRYGEGRDHDTVDRISVLPDAVLHRILSRVPIRDAVRTSLLSKRWQHLWQFIPKLEFFQRQFRKRSNFMDLVDRALLLRGSFSVEEFTLSCDAKSDTVRISSWIASVAMRDVRKLLLSIRRGRDPVVFPSCLFRCGTLTRLEISFNRPQDLVLPCSVRLSRLEELRLERVRFLDYGSVQNLLLSCPALVGLTIEDCHWTGLDGKTISAPNLQRLAITHFYAHAVHAGECCSSRVVISGPNVKSFNYFGKADNAYCLVGASSLNEAKLSVSYPANDNRANLDSDLVGFSDQFQELYNVGSLTLSARVFGSATGDDVFHGLPIFWNMTKLKLEGHVFLGSKALDTLLAKSPCLEVLEISQDSFDELDEEVPQVLDHVPPCFESQLKTIVVHCPWPAKVNIEWIGLLLRKANVLEDMVLYYVKSKEADDKLEHLTNLPRGSIDCRISLLERSTAKRKA